MMDDSKDNDSITLTSAASDDDEGDEESDSDEEISRGELESTNGLISETRAKEIALERIGGGVIGFESEREHGQILYEVELRRNAKT